MGRKYYIVEISERNGEYEYSNTQLLSISSRMNLDKALQKHAKRHYPDATDVEYDDKNNGYYFNCGEVFVKAGQALEITEAMFIHLSKASWIQDYTY